jgi:hypothetical protein
MDLVENVPAVTILIHHPLDTPNLSLDAAEPRAEVLSFILAKLHGKKGTYRRKAASML